MGQFISDADIDPAKGFLKAIGSAYYKYGKRETVRNELRDQFSNVEKAAKTDYVKKELIEIELKKLSDKINEVLEIEKQLLHIDKSDNQLISSLQDKVSSIDQKFVQVSKGGVGFQGESGAKHNQMEKRLQDTANKISSFINSQKEREQRLLKLEKTLKTSGEHNQELLLKIDQNIKRLEERFQSLDISGKYNNLDLGRVEAKLNSLKGRMKRLKINLS